jgi:threonine dehydratase
VRFDERVWLKLENLQPTNAYKIRGASNAVAKLSDEGPGQRRVDDQRRQCRTRRRLCSAAVWRALHRGHDRDRAADQARPHARARREIVPVSYERAWVAAESHEFPGLDATFVHPFDNHDFIAGHGTMGLEIVEDCPHVATVICAIGGGGLITGVGSAIKAKRPEAKVLGAEPETAAPYALSLREGGPRKFTDWEASFVDGAGRQERHRAHVAAHAPVVDGSITVTLDQTRDAMRLIAEKSRTIAEGAARCHWPRR